MKQSWHRRVSSGLALLTLGLCLLVSGASNVAANSPTRRLNDIRTAITELDVAEARRLLGASSRTPELAFERARLYVYEGNCVGAAEALAEDGLGGDEELAQFHEFAERCAGATVGGVVYDDSEQGVWVRLQDGKDSVLIPWLVEVAVRARRTMEQDFNMVLPRPLRIELVRDLFSLSAVSGLPLEAAETTGTVAVARFGRVTMISPRAAPHGYPWQDTLAHEIAHLSLTRKTGDHAPLWLQEGVAKIQETRWREPHRLERETDAHGAAEAAEQAGAGIRIDRIGPSIAMLPTADAAATAFAMVESFVRFWIERSGTPAFWLFLADLRGLESPDPDLALRSTTGYSLSVWVDLWKRYLAALGPRPADPPPFAVSRHRARDLRLAEVLLEQGEPGAALAPAKRAAGEAGVSTRARALLARTLLANGQPWGARRALSQQSPVLGAHTDFLALLARFDAEEGRPAEAAQYLGHALSLNPLSELVACTGHERRFEPHAPMALPFEQWPLGLEQRTLCESVRPAPGR